MLIKGTDFPYEPAPKGSADNYRTTCRVRISWRNAPARFVRRVSCPVKLPDGFLYLDKTGPAPVIRMEVDKHVCFDVSVAPSCPKAMPGACAHDQLYKYSELLARHWGCTVRQVLELADHWFLALMRGEQFALSRAYFTGVSLFGYWFHKLTAPRAPGAVPLPH